MGVNGGHPEGPRPVTVRPTGGVLRPGPRPNDNINPDGIEEGRQYVEGVCFGESIRARCVT